MTKYILRQVTSTHEIERTCRRNDVRATMNSLDSSTKLGKVNKKLKSYCQEGDVNPKIISEVFEVKNIRKAEKNSRIIIQVLQKISNIYRSRNLIESIRATPYSNSDSNETKLMQIWNSLKPNEKLENRFSRQWIDIGFQGEDPATDFRGSGMLGLTNLHSFVKTEESREIYKTSIDQPSEYFFASAGIYISLKISEWIKSGFLDNVFENCSLNEETLKMTNEIYNSTFIAFNRHWLALPERSFMIFNTEIETFFLKREAEIRAK